MAARVMKMCELISNAAIQTFCVIGLKMSFQCIFPLRAVGLSLVHRLQDGRSTDQTGHSALFLI